MSSNPGMSPDPSASSPAGPVADQDSLAASAEEGLRVQVRELTQRAERLLANWQRAEADLANFRKSVDRERSELVALASAALTVDLLPILDDLDRALTTVAPELQSYTWVDGVWFIARKLEAVLTAHGLEEVPAQGQTLDPQLHQAVTEAEGEPGKVLRVIQKGYRIRGRLLRPALVVVGKSPPTSGAPQAAPGPTPAS